MQAELPTITVNQNIPKPSGKYKKNLIKNLKNALDHLELTTEQI